MSSIFLPTAQASVPRSKKPPSALREADAKAPQPPKRSTAHAPIEAIATDGSVPPLIELAPTPQGFNPMLRLPKVLELTGCAESTWHRYVKQGLAPRGRRLGPNTVGWLLSDIQAWLQSRPLA